MKKGDKVVVYHDPVFCERIEGNAVVIRVLGSFHYDDVLGREMFQCTVMFDNEPGAKYERTVSHLIGE